MLQLSKIYYDRKILSLRTGGPVGHALSPLINPTNLKIEGWYAAALGERSSMILPLSQVRDIIQKGIVVDDHTALTESNDLVRLKKIIDIGYEVIGKNVLNEKKHKIGKVADYAVDVDSMTIKKIYVGQSLVRSFRTEQLIIDRSQIVELNDRFIVIKDAREKLPFGKRATAAA